MARNFVREGEKETFDLFQGKTYEELTGWHDFHARQYDATLGRWFGVDAYAHRMPGVSPYNAMANNPVMFLDPDGNEPITFAVIGLAMLKGALIGSGVSAASYGLSTAISGQSWNWGQFGKSMAIGAISGAITGGIDVWSTSLMKNVYWAIPGALVKGGLSGVGGGLAGGFGNVIMENDWGAFGAGFGKGAMTAGIMGGVSGGVGGYLNAKNSAFERNLIFGGLTENGKQAALDHFTLKYELFQSGAYTVGIGETNVNAFGEVKPISPLTEKDIGLINSVDKHPNGVNSKYTLSTRRMTLNKIEANVIHEKRHILDLHQGIAHKIWIQSGKNSKVFQAML